MEIYDKHAMTLVKDVLPKEDLKALVNTFLCDAGINMGNDFTDSTLERTIEIVETNFRFLPVCYIASAFKKGSLGHYGTGRLVPRVIYSWLNEISLEYNRDQDHKKHEANSDLIHFSDLDRYPLGKAINKKIDWLKSEAITSEEWDTISLKELAELIGRGSYPTPENFGITPKI